MFIENEGNGLVFENNSDNPKAPQLSGNINVAGVQYSIALWEKDGKNGVFYSVLVQESDEEDTGQRRNSGSTRRVNSNNNSQRRGKPRR